MSSHGAPRLDRARGRDHEVHLPGRGGNTTSMCPHSLPFRSTGLAGTNDGRERRVARRLITMQVRDRVRRFIQDSFLVDNFADDESFLASGIIDSLGVMQLVSFVESEFSVRVADPDLVPENFDSVEKVSAFVQRKLAA